MNPFRLIKPQIKMMKKYATILMTGALVTASAHAGGVVDQGVGLVQENALIAPSGAPLLSAGTQEFGVAGSLDFDSGIEYDLAFTYGVFIRDNWQVGLTIDWAGEDGDIFQNTRFGLFTEYNFVNRTKFVPFVGLGAAYAVSGDQFDFEQGTTTRVAGVDGIAFTGEIGVKYFFRPNIAVAASVNYNWSPDDVFDIGDEIGDSLTQVEIGMRFYF